MSNKCVERSKISEAQFREVLRYFARDLTVTDTADITVLSRPTNSHLSVLAWSHYRLLD